MNDYDVFICYRGSNLQGCELGARIDECFAKDKLARCFFAPNAIPHGHDFKNQIPQLMQTVRVVILLLGADFFRPRGTDDIVMFELDHALQNPVIQFLPIVFGDFDYENEDLSHFDADAISRFKYRSAINYHGIYDDNVNSKIMPTIYRLLQRDSLMSDMRERGGKHYIPYDWEVDYMHMQQTMLMRYDAEVREPLLQGKRYVLDLGCNDGKITWQLFNKDGIDQVVGVDLQAEQIQNAECMYGDDRMHFYVMDLDADDVDQRLSAVMSERHIDKFDFINCTMVLLHLRKPFQLLKVLRKHLSSDGCIYIRDIDDDFNFFYPDKNGIFARLQNMIAYMDTWGYRKSGKEVYSLLKLAGFSRVSVAKQGLNTAQMDYDERETLFDIYFESIPRDALLTAENHPDNVLIKGEARWAADNIEEANSQFHRDEFIFSLGYIVYVAQR